MVLNSVAVPGGSAELGTSARVDRLLRKHYSFQQTSFLSAQEQKAGGILAFSSITPIPMWNHAAWIEGEQAAFADFLQSSKTWHSSKGRRPAVYVPEPQTEQIQALKSAGFEKFDEEAWMACELSAATHVTDPDVKEVRNEALLEKFIQTFSAAFQARAEAYRPALTASSAPESQSYHFVFEDAEGNTCAVGTLISDGTYGCIYNVGTPPAFRNKGYGRRIFEHICAFAKSAGCQTLFLQVENNSAAQRLYSRSGFQTEFVRSGFRLAEWSPQKATGTKLSRALGFRPKQALAQDYIREVRALPAFLTGNPTLGGNELSRYCNAAWAYLVYRYTGEEVVHFTVCSHSDKTREAIKVVVQPASSLADFLNQAGETSPAPEEAAESFLCLNLEGRPSHIGEHHHPLEIHLLVTSGTVEMIYRADLFSKHAIRRMAAHFTTILEYIAQHPKANVSEIEILSPSERNQLLVEWNSTGFEGTDETIAQLFEARVERTPDATAVMLVGANSGGNREELTYRQLNRKANRLAHHLQELGVKPEVFVGVYLGRSLDMIVSLLAIFKAGGACVPLDPAYPEERIRFMMQDTSAPLILTHRELLPQLGAVGHTKLICVDDLQKSPRAENEKNPSLHASGDAAAYIIYTSGSTGKPKGVVINNHSIANHCVDCKNYYGLNPRDRVLQFSSFNFDASFEQILAPLISGAALVVRDNDVWTTRQFIDKLRDLQLSVADIPTAYWHQLATDLAADPGSVPQNNLRLVIVGGEAMSPEKAALWQRTPLRHVRLINAYGPTETTITATAFEVPEETAAESESTAMPIGKPRGDRKLYVLDRYGAPTPIGIPGELHIGGSLLARGYHRRPELTSARFIPNPFSDDPSARLYKTGDLVRYLEDGNLEFLGRIDDQVKIRGFRIELGEVESCIQRYPDVRETVVLARAEPGEESRLIAYIIPVHEHLEIRQLRNHLKEKLPDYMIPGAFVVLKEWPLMPNGKVDRRALPAPQETPAESTVKGPEDPLELQLQLLFERVLKRAPIAVDASFFELGGDSLQALELLVQIEKATGKQLPLGTLYQSSTVQSLAREVQQRTGVEGWSSLVPLQVSGRRPPFILLHTTPGDILGYGNLVFRLDQDQPCYGFQSLGLKEASLSHTSVRQMAEYYVRLLQEFQPHGPYYLGGWCYGGLVAVEMAQILRQKGEEIGLLALLETVAMPARYSNWRYYLHRVRCFLRMTPKRWATYFREKARYARESRIANKMRFRQAADTQEDTLRDERLAKLEHVYNTNLAALDGYRSEYYDGKVTLFNAAERDAALIPDPQYGWVGLAQEVEIHEVPGDHDTMLTEPNVSALAKRLNDCLLRAQKNQEGLQSK